ncbi:MAG: tripartite tricarboxylate transporter substrate binding protein [Rhodoferax sp.]|nr:tripartite tricarboxylate transporter substrate binding protein [Rhodoferax sp.]
MTHNRQTLVQAVVAACWLVGASSAIWAQDAYPNRAISIIVPYAAGGTTDLLARAIQRPMQEFLKQPVIIENKAGAGGTIGTDQVVKSAPDGYTLVFGNSGPNAIASLMRKIPYDPIKDLRPIATVALTPMILAVPADSPAKTLKEFLVLAKQNSDKWNYGSVGNGSLSHLTGEYFNALTGLKLLHVPYQGGAPMMTAFGGGQLQAAFVTGLDGAGMFQAGRVRYLAVATPQRTSVVPGLPALAEEIPGFRSVAWFGVLAPAGVSDTVINRLNQAVEFAVTRPDVQKMFADRNIEPRAGKPDDLARLIQGEMSQWGDVIKRANIKAD